MAEGEPERRAFRLSAPTAIISGINLLAYAAMLLSGGRGALRGASSQTLMRFGASYAPLVFEGQVFRLVTSVFLHLNLMHLLMNSAALFSIGPIVERDYGRPRFVILYLLSGVAGAIVSVFAHRADPVVSAGASGAICGVVAAGAVCALRERRLAESRNLFLWGGATLVFGAVIHADNAAHLGGLALGALLGAAFRRARLTTATPAWPSVAVVAISLLAFVAAIRARSRSETAADAINRGVDLSHADDDDGATAAYRRALELEPNDPTAHYDLGLALERRNQFDEAIEHFERALQLEPDDTHRHALASAHVNHGVWLAQNEDYAGAIVAYKKALEIEEGNANAHRNLGLALARGGDRASGIQELRRAFELSATDEMKRALSSLLIDDGSNELEAGNRGVAILRFKEAVGLEPNAWYTHYNLGLALIESDPDAAVAELEKAWGFDHSAPVQSALARAIEARRDARADGGNLGGALDDLERATLLGLQKPSESDAGGPSTRGPVAEPLPDAGR